MVAVHHGDRQSVSSVAAAAGGVRPLVVNEETNQRKLCQVIQGRLPIGCRGSYLIQELLDEADLTPTRTRTQLLQQLHVLHLEPGEPIREEESGFTQVSSDHTLRTSYRRFGCRLWFHHT